MSRANDQSPFVSALADRLLPELGRLEDAGFVQAFSEPNLTYKHKIAFGLKRTAEQPAGVQAYRYEDHLLVTTSGDRSFGGPLDLGATHQALLDAGDGVMAKSLNPRREYRAEILREDAQRAATLMARTLELLGARDPDAVEVLVEADG